MSSVKSDCSKNLLEAKRARQQTERDATMLTNRIALLKQEELKTLKKIDETRKRANEVYLIKKINEQRINKQIEDLQQKNNQRTQNKERNMNLKQRRQIEQKRIMEAVQMTKSIDGKQIRNQAYENTRLKQHNLQNSLQECQYQNQNVRQMEKIANQKKVQIKKQLDVKTKQDYNQRLATEEMMITIKEEEVRKMEMLEMELIKKLQTTQNIQKVAYKELEEVLAQPTIQLQEAKRRILDK